MKRFFRRLYASVVWDDLFMRVAWSLFGILLGRPGVAILVMAAQNSGAPSYAYCWIGIALTAAGAIMISRCALPAHSRLARLLDKYPPDAAAEEGLVLVAIIYLPAASLTIFLRSLGIRGQRTGYRTFAKAHRQAQAADAKADREDEPVQLPEAYTLVTVLLHPGGNQRVLIVKRHDGHFSYRNEERVPVYDPELAERLQDYSTAWTPTGRTAIICDTAEAAEREARGAVMWLQTLDAEERS